MAAPTRPSYAQECQRIIGLVPSGSTSRPKVELVTRPKLVYMASVPQTIPTQPPASVSAAMPKSAPKPSRQNAIHSVKKIHHSARERRNVLIQRYIVSSPHSSSATPL